MTNIKHYFFYDEETGEEFIVGAENLAQAKDIAETYFGEPVFQYEMTEVEAEMSGLDEY